MRPPSSLFSITLWRIVILFSVQSIADHLIPSTSLPFCFRVLLQGLSFAIFLFFFRSYHRDWWRRIIYFIYEHYSCRLLSKMRFWMVKDDFLFCYAKWKLSKLFRKIVYGLLFESCDESCDKIMMDYLGEFSKKKSIRNRHNNRLGVIPEVFAE